MHRHTLYRWSIALALAATTLASPADAQKKKDKKNDRARPELVRRDDHKAREKALKREQKEREKWLKEDYQRRREDLRRERDRWESRDARWDDRTDGRRRNVPPGWCKGKGNPHNTPENCGYNSDRRDRRADDRYDDRYDDRRDRRADDRYDDRYDDRRDRRYGSYEREHDEFHRWHDRECRAQAAERPLDLTWQIRIRQQCKARHDEWHYRAGRSHG